MIEISGDSGGWFIRGVGDAHWIYATSLMETGEVSCSERPTTDRLLQVNSVTLYNISIIFTVVVQYMYEVTS